MEKKKAVALRGARPVVMIGRSPIEIIQSAVAMKGGTIEQMRELLAFQKEWESNEAKKAYYEAMSAFKASLPMIDRNKKVDYAAGTSRVKYAYSTLFNAINKVTPILSQFGLSLAWFHKQTDKELTVTCRITHKLGYSEETSLSGAHDNTGSKNAIQALGSTNAYLERYTFFALIGTAAKDQDDDGQKSGPPATAPSGDTSLIADRDLHQLRDLMMDAEANEKAFLGMMKIAKLEDLPKARLEAAKTILASIKASHAK